MTIDIRSCRIAPQFATVALNDKRILCGNGPGPGKFALAVALCVEYQQTFTAPEVTDTPAAVDQSYVIAKRPMYLKWPQYDGNWFTQLQLNHGHHHYLFLIDGKAALDPRAQGVGRNEMNEKVSVVAVS